MMCTAEDLRRINAIPKAYPGSGEPTVFFRGQLLELMRWAARLRPIRTSPKCGLAVERWEARFVIITAQRSPMAEAA